MDVILLERIEKLGQMGDIVAVKDGYARNFLLPQKKALRATEESKAQFETQRVQLEADNLKRRGEAGAVAENMKDISIIMVRQAGDSGQLYGSVSSRDISDGVTADGFTISRNQVVLNRPIKTLGLHQIDVQLHPEVQILITVNVARTPEEAKLQAEGIDVSAMEDYAEAEEIQAEAEAVFAEPEDDSDGEQVAEATDGDETTPE